MECGLLEALVGFTVVVIAFYYYLTLHFDFWKQRNVEGPKPIPFFGNLKDVFFGKTHMAMLTTRFYNEYKNEPIIGMYLNWSPALILRDADIIKDVLIKDFLVFCDRGIYISKKDVLDHNLVALEYKKWRPLRNKLSAVFTGEKLKEMFYLMVDCADNFERYIEKFAENSEIIEFREPCAKFTTQVIGECVFGLDTKSIADENSEFYRCGKHILESSFHNTFRRWLRDYVPALYDMLGPYKFSTSC
ncbi:cytochrome P450 6B2-like [Copidosoma floridanum]|uniref:cytochrome P450 6B2-like n=1 Tax=Copidosoma floridanum TaxID=29053 RepID=UPI0006C97894|nr:cytochrome P450 6B2-like [Copidosoma floridanum]